VDKATPLLPPVPEHPGCDSISAVVRIASTLSVAILIVVLDELIETGIVLDELIDEIGIVLDELIETGIVLDELIGEVLPIVVATPERPLLRIFCAAIWPQVTMVATEPTAMPSAPSSSFTSVPSSTWASVLVLSALYWSNIRCWCSRP
jgi:hypothetical protein